MNHNTVPDFSLSIPPLSVHVTEILEKAAPRAHSPEMRKAIMSEVSDLVRRNALQVMLKQDLPDDSNAVTARFVLAIKLYAEGNTKCKERYVMDGHRDKLKHYMVYGAQTL